MYDKNRSFEAQLTYLSLLSSVPIFLFMLWIMIYVDISIWLILLTAILGGLTLFYSNYRIYQKTAYHLRSLSNIFEGLKQGEYSLRARSLAGASASAELVEAINKQAQDLSQLRWKSAESQHLLNTVIQHIDVAAVALNEDNQIRLLNPAAKKLLQHHQEQSNSDLVQQLAFAQTIRGGSHQVIKLSLGQHQGSFDVHVEEFREAGLPHKLLFITDVSNLLRSEERKAWQSLLRVISHEINNSLTPIASISQTLNQLLKNQDSDSKDNKELIEGLEIINQRAISLGRFVDSYKQLAKLPEPQQQNISVTRLVRKIGSVFKNQTIAVTTEGDVEIFVDPDQFEQVLINLFKNAIEAMEHEKTNGVITVEWCCTKSLFKLTICDQGCGISNPDNLFVPFYSTKKHGSGIGLVLCRQIVEAHNGHLSIANKNQAPGCRACIEIPRSFANHHGN